LRSRLSDFGASPQAPESGGYGVVYVRWGKASKGSPPKRRSVLTVFPWPARVLGQWVERFRGLSGQAAAGGGALWPGERSPRVSREKVSARFAGYRDAPGLRRSYITHLIEDGYDPLFVQQQAGHCYASTTALYTSVSSDFRNRALRAALDRPIRAALRGDAARGKG
jgi:integrase/recombinase XerC